MSPFGLKTLKLNDMSCGRFDAYWMVLHGQTTSGNTVLGLMKRGRFTCLKKAAYVRYSLLTHMHVTWFSGLHLGWLQSR